MTMINIGTKYAIKADGNGYALYERRIAEKDMKIKVDGKEVKAGHPYLVSLESYHGTIRDCVKKLIRLRGRDEIAERDMTLGEAAEMFERVEREVYEWARIGEVRSDG